jgi:pimeloyl-ACP methyl ester carboxylesterase
MKGLIVAVAALVMGPAAMAGAQTTAPPLSAEATKSFADFESFGPHRAFVVGPDGKAAWWAGVGGPDPGNAVASAMRRCEERNKQGCVLYTVNNYTVTGGEWRQLVPERAADTPDIGRLRPEPYWSMRGPQRATGLIVWSHGYKAGKNSTENAPQPWMGRFTHLGYDLYRFDREWINDWPGDATALAAAVAKARQLGYRRILLAGQSAGAWVSLAALQRGAPVDGVISISAAHHGEVTKMRDTTRARSEWQHLIEALKPGPKVVLVNFAGDDYDVGGRMADARSAFAKSGVEAVIIDDPSGFKGHFAGSDFSFARKFGPCIQAFVEKGTKLPPPC